MAKNFVGFEPIFGEAAAEWERGSAKDPYAVSPRRSFLFHAHLLDSLRLEMVATDFGSQTLQRVLTVADLEDIRDETGISGSWSDFVDYFSKSLSSDSVKLLLRDGATSGKITAHKSKGLPRIAFSLNRLSGSLASDAMAHLSLALYATFKENNALLMKEREKQLEMTKLLTSEKVKNELLQKQLDNFTFKRKMHKPKASDRTGLPSEFSIETGGAAGAEAQPSEMPSGKETQPTRPSHRVAPLRRVKARGARLADTD